MVEWVAFRHFIVSTNRIGNKNGSSHGYIAYVCVGTSADSGPRMHLKLACSSIKHIHTHERNGRSTPANDGIVSERFENSLPRSHKHTHTGYRRHMDRTLFVLPLCRVVKIENCLRANVIVFLWGCLFFACIQTSGAMNERERMRCGAEQQFVLMCRLITDWKCARTHRAETGENGWSMMCWCAIAVLIHLRFFSRMRHRRTSSTEEGALILHIVRCADEWNDFAANRVRDSLGNHATWHLMPF